MTFTALRPRDCGFGACNCSLEFLVVVYARCLYNSAHWFTFLHACKLLNLRLPKPILCRSDLLTSGSRDGPGYLPREDPRLDDRSRRLLRETDPLGPAYDRYVRNGLSSYGSSGLNAGDLGGLGTGLGRSVGSGLAGSALDDQILMGRRVSVDAGLGGKGQGLGYKDSQLRDPLRRSDDHLPPDASNTLFVEGLPPKCTRREAAHIFRPFVGFKEVRLVNKEARNPGGEPLVLCFVDFANPNCAATAMEALQGYKFDENERDSPSLKLQFARYPGPRGGGSSFGRDRDDYRRR